MGVRETIGRGISRAFGGSGRQGGRAAAQQEYREAQKAFGEAMKSFNRRYTESIEKNGTILDSFEDPEHMAALRRLVAAEDAVKRAEDNAPLDLGMRGAAVGGALGAAGMLSAEDRRKQRTSRARAKMQ